MIIHSSWEQIINKSLNALSCEYKTFLKENKDYFPQNYLAAFSTLPLNKTSAILFGQDPYPTEGVACGLAFAVSPGSKKPQSLKNLMKELASDIPEATNHGDLERWNNQGVMLLNSALTTKIGNPGAHSKIWSGFTSSVIRTLDSELSGSLICLSLGEHAKKLAQQIQLGEVIQATHPSPLSASRGFYGSKIYSRVNQALEVRSIAPIDWSC